LAPLKKSYYVSIFPIAMWPEMLEPLCAPESWRWTRESASSRVVPRENPRKLVGGGGGGGGPTPPNHPPPTTPTHTPPPPPPPPPPPAPRPKAAASSLGLRGHTTTTASRAAAASTSHSDYRTVIPYSSMSHYINI
jgi:hypothetical protein